MYTFDVGMMPTDKTYILLFISFCLVTLSDDYFQKHTALSMVWSHVTQFGDESRPLVLINARYAENFFRQAFFGPLMFQWLEESSPYRSTFGRHWSPILATWPTQRSCDFNRWASVLTVSACMSTVYVVKSLQWMQMTVWRYRWGKCAGHHSPWGYSTNSTGGWSLPKLWF